MKYLVIILLLAACYPKIGSKSLFKAEVKITRLDNSIDTIDVVYFDYMILDLDHALKKKDGKEITRNVKSYKILNKQRIKL
jgi:hypothetical protein